MPTYQFGDVILVPFPFTDQSGTKQRPGVVVSTDSYHRARHDLIMMPISAQLRSGIPFGEVALRDWQAAGLLKPSIVKPVLATVDRTLVRRTLGRLSTSDAAALKAAIVTIVG